MTALLPAPTPGDPAAALNAARRERDLDALARGEVVDVLVIGGGITGVGVALDAVTRGLSVALVERADLANGTSRWSSKLVHGGLRYLAHGDFEVAAESAYERGVLATRTAPHLVRGLPFVTPLGLGLARLPAVATAAGLVAGDGLRRIARTPGDVLPRPRRVTTAEAKRLVPAVRAAGMRGALLHWDGQLEDDARLVVSVARTAAAHGARILTRVRALDVGPGGALVEDVLTGSRVDVLARHVVNATGVWAASLDPRVLLRPSRGSHLVLPAAAFGRPAAALMVPVPDSFGRFVFAVPTADDLVILGLTDEPLDGPVPDEVLVPGPEEISFLLDAVSSALDRPLDRADVIGAYTGIRPLLAGDKPSRTADLSRRHAVLDRDGMVTVVGGKLTTYRRMAADVVDRLTSVPCVTERLPLVGAGLLPPDVAALPGRLVRRYGAEAGLVAAAGSRDRSLLEPVAPDVPVLGVEILWAVRQEGALSVDDVLDRRTRLGLVPAWRSAAEAAVAALVEAANEGVIGAQSATDAG